MDYAKTVQIDPFQLDLEWQKQPKYMLECLEVLADARKELDAAKEACDLITAETYVAIRDSADGKITEKTVESMLTMDADVRAAKAALLNARHVVAKLEAAKAGFEHKKSALENLVRLHGMGYFVEPSADIQARGALDEMRQEDIKSRVRIGRTDKPVAEPEMIRRKK